jgi:hypothetical protein
MLPVADLVSSLFTHGSLVPAIDAHSLGRPFPGDEWCETDMVVDLPSTVIRLLWEYESGDREHDGRSRIKLSTGVLSIALKLHKPTTTRQRELLRCLSNNGISSARLRECALFARSLGVGRAIRSKPAIGRWYAKRRNNI